MFMYHGGILLIKRHSSRHLKLYSSIHRSIAVFRKIWSCFQHW